MPDRMSVEEIEALVTNLDSHFKEGFSCRSCIGTDLLQIIRQLLEERSEDSKIVDWIEKHLNYANKSGYGADDYWWSIGFNDGNPAEGSTFRRAIQEGRGL